MNDARPPIDLQAVAKEIMLAHGFQPDFPPAVERQLASLPSQAPAPGGNVRDLRGLLWSSIDNDTSKDLDQIEVVKPLTNGDVKVLVGIADVDVDVAKGTAIDEHAAAQATTVYTGIRNFSMLPERLSTGITSLLSSANSARTPASPSGLIAASQSRRKVSVKSARLAAIRSSRSSARAASPSRSVKKPSLRRSPAARAASNCG